MIRYVKHKNIDKLKWDKALADSFNRLPYAISWYLDTASPNWDALIKGDYEEVMPLTQRKFLGINYLFQPLACPRLGVFSTTKKQAFNINEYIEQIPDKFKLIEISVNELNLIDKSTELVQNKIRCFQLIKSNNHGHLSTNKYSKSHRKNIRKFERNPLYEISKNHSFADFYHLKISNIKKNTLNWKTRDRKIYYDLLAELHQRGKLEIQIAKDKSGTILAGLAIIEFDFGRYSFQSFCTDAGKSTGAVFYLIHQIIQKLSHTDCTLDFMGSSVSGIRKRNLGFNSEEQTYQSLKINRLNRLIKLIKP